MLIDSFIKYKGWGGDYKRDNFPLAPYILADALAIAHDDYLKGRLKHGAKKHANKMMECYDHLNKDFFRAFTFEETLLITDKMDTFGEHLHHEFEEFRMAVMSPLSDYSQEIRETIAGLCLCKLLAIQIDYLWSLMYRDQWGRPLENTYIKGIKHNACEMFNQYKANRKKDCIDLNDVPRVQESVNNIIKKTREFIDAWEED